MTRGKLTYERFLFYILWSLLIISLGQVIFSLFCSKHILFDDIEHLRAAYFVSLGDVPYRDFFEHHHPLLWYMLAPLIPFLPRDTITTVYIGRLICLGISLVGGYFIYKTEKRFIGGTLCALFCLVFYFWGINSVSAVGLFHVKPDIFQRCCFFIGLYYLFCYFRYKKFRDLQICALLFTVAFLFLQTAVFYVAPLAIPVCYFLYKNPQRWIDFAKAAVLPLIILAACVAILWKLDLLSRYFETNWQINSAHGFIGINMEKSYFIVANIADIMLIACIALGVLIYHKKLNIYILSFVSLMVCEFLLRSFYVSYVYYLTWLVIFAAMLAAPVLAKISIKFKGGFILFAVLWGIHFCSNLCTVDCQKFFALKNYIALTKGETVCSNVFENRYAYYWMYPLHIEALDDVLFHPVSDYDINTIYRQRNAQILIMPPQKDKWYRAFCESFNLTPEQKAVVERHLIDDFVKENYIEIDEYIYQRKDTLPAPNEAR